MDKDLEDIEHGALRRLNSAKDDLYDAIVDYTRKHFTEENYPGSSAMTGRVVLSVSASPLKMWVITDKAEKLKDGAFFDLIRALCCLLSSRSALGSGFAVYLKEK